MKNDELNMIDTFLFQFVVPSSSQYSDAKTDNHFAFGDILAKPPQDKLWTKLELINYVRFKKASLGKAKIPSGELFQLYKSVASDLMVLFHSAFIPTFRIDYSATVLKEFVEKEIKDAQRKKADFIGDSSFKQSWIDKRGLNVTYAFSVRCPCFINCASEAEIVRSGCQCDPGDKIPNLAFFRDQMFQREQIIFHSEEDKAYFKGFMEGMFIY